MTEKNIREIQIQVRQAQSNIEGVIEELNQEIQAFPAEGKDGDGYRCLQEVARHLQAVKSAQAHAHSYLQSALHWYSQTSG